MQIHSFVLAVVASVLAGLSIGASADSTDTDRALGAASDTAAAKARYAPLDASGRGRYIVLLVDTPVASYRGGGALPPAPLRPGSRRPDLGSPQADAYRTQLRARQDALLAALPARLGRSVAAEQRLQNVLNALVLRLAPDEVDALRRHPDVRLVARERIRPLASYGSPSLIGAPALWDGSAVPGGVGSRGEGVVVGVLDTGINWSSSSFKAASDDGYQHVNPLGAGTYLGLCGPGFADAGRCNAKLIGMYNFVSTAATRSGVDTDGHGSHTASTAAGGLVQNAPFAGGSFAVSGVAPRATVVSYLVCNDSGCPDGAIIAAVEQAVIDRVDVINYSIGGPTESPWNDPTDLAFLAAHDAGVFVAAAAGNDGPAAGTVENEQPWVTTVAATTPNALPAFNFALGGPGTPPANTQTIALVPGSAPLPSQAYTGLPLLQSPNFANGNSDGCSAYPKNSFREPKQNNGTRGIAVLRLDQNASTCSSVTRRNNAANAGALAVVFVDPEYINLAASGGSYSMLLADWQKVRAHTNAGHGSGAVATIGYPIGAGNRAADRIAGFSSRGPSPFAALKPDLGAPGDTILAAVVPVGANSYGTLSGTSMATPHVAGAAALLRALHPSWTPSELKSALMTSANPAVQNETGSAAVGPIARGAGRIDLGAAARVGLVFEESGAAYAAADPALDGAVEALNLASLYHPECVGTCSFPRRVRGTGTAANWSISVSGLPAGSVSLDRNSFALTANGSATFEVSVDSTALVPGDWYSGTLTLTPDVPALPVARLPIAVRAAPPRLATDVDAIRLSLPAGRRASRTVEVANLGNPTLSWLVVGTTLPGNVQQQSAGSTGAPNATIGSAATSRDKSNSYSADDFVLLTGGARLTALEASGFMSDGSLAADASLLTWRVYADASGQPAGRPGFAGDPLPLFSHTSAPTGPGITHLGDAVRLDLALAGLSSPVLPAGRYWLSVAPSVAGTTNYWYWLNATTPNAPIAWHSYPNASGSAANKLWIPANDAFATDLFDGFAMTVDARVGCGASWLSVDAGGGVLGIGGRATLGVTLDAAALAEGRYTTYLCISSNGSSPVPANLVLPVELTVTPTMNAAPAAVADAYSLPQDVPLAVAAPGVLGNDSDGDGDPLQAQLATNVQHGVLALAAGGGFTYTPITGYCGGDAFSYRAGDGQAQSAPASVTLDIHCSNGPPVAVGLIPAQGHAENQTVSLATAPYFNDPDGDALAYAASGLPPGLAISPASGLVSGTLPYGAEGSYSVTVSASDGSGVPATQAFGWTVVHSNQLPSAGNDGYATDRNVALVVAAPGVLGNDSDPDNDALSTQLSADVLHGTLVLAADGGFSYQPTADFCGSDSFRYRANDGSGNSNLATVSLGVTCTNRPPQASADAYSTPRNVVLAVGAPGVLGNDSDPDDNPLTSQLQPGSASNGNVSLAANGSFSFTPTAAYCGPAGFSYRAHDGVTTSAASAVAINVACTNQPPVAVGAIAEQANAENDLINLSSAAHFSDPDGNTLAYTATGLPPGVAIGGSTGLIAGRLGFDAEGSYAVTVTASDGEFSVAQAFAWDVAHTNQAPARNGSMPARSDVEGSAVSLATAGYFIDADGDPLSYTALNLPEPLLINPATGLISGTLAFGSAGGYSVTVSASDGGAGVSQVFNWNVGQPPSTRVFRSGFEP